MLATAARVVSRVAVAVAAAAFRMPLRATDRETADPAETLVSCSNGSADQNEQ
jgi:hypothetical protein